MGKSILIIGAGIGGLSTGIYARLNGFDARIVEMHRGPGGVCTGWRRGGYVFDGCIHNLAGTSEDSRFRQVWRDLGAIPAVRMRGYEELVTVERPDGPPLVLYTDLERLRAHLKSLAPRDHALIDELVDDARWFAGFDLMGLSLAPAGERTRAAVRAAPMLAKWGGQTLESFARRFQDPFLREAFPTVVYDWPQQSMLMVLYFLGRASRGDLGWPEGGALAFSGAIEKRFCELGGRIEYGARAAAVLVEDDRAVGVELSDGRTIKADVVVSNANGYETVYGMLGGRYVSRRVSDYYAAPVDRYEMGVHVSLGVKRDLSSEPHAIVLPLSAPMVIDGELRERLYVEPFAFDPTLAPPGCSVLKVVLPTSWRRWRQLSRDPGAYKAEQQAIADQVVTALSARFPGLREDIEVVDVATPITTWRITGNGQGYAASVDSMMMALLAGRRRSMTLPGLRGFYMVGQWAGVPGVPMVAGMGRDVVRRICRRERRPFHTGQDARAAA